MRKVLNALCWPLLWAALVLWSGWAHAGGLDVNGRVLGPGGAGLAGALVSDGVNLTRSEADGAFHLASEPGRVVAVSAPEGFTPAGRWWWPASEAQGLAARLEPAPASEPPLVAILSDPHLMDAPSLGRGCSAQAFRADLPLEVWQRTAAEVRALRPNLTLVGGDLCLDADAAQPSCARAQMETAARAMDLLPAPARAIPGNHDVRYQDGQVDYALWSSLLGPRRQIYLLGGAAWLLLDNPGLGQDPQGRTRSLGRLPDEALAWLKKALDLLPAETPLVVVTHYPLASALAGANPLYRRALVQDPAGEGPGWALRDADQQARAVLSLLKGRRVLALINGHEHAFHETWLHLRQGPWRLLGLPALCGMWWLGDRPWQGVEFAPGWLSLRLAPSPTGPVLEPVFHEAKF